EKARDTEVQDSIAAQRQHLTQSIPDEPHAWHHDPGPEYEKDHVDEITKRHVPISSQRVECGCLHVEHRVDEHAQRDERVDFQGWLPPRTKEEWDQRNGDK